jgi:hypothetical protein
MAGKISLWRTLARGGCVLSLHDADPRIELASRLDVTDQLFCERAGTASLRRAIDFKLLRDGTPTHLGLWNRDRRLVSTAPLSRPRRMDANDTLRLSGAELFVDPVERTRATEDERSAIVAAAVARRDIFGPIPAESPVRIRKTRNSDAELIAVTIEVSDSFNTHSFEVAVDDQ